MINLESLKDHIFDLVGALYEVHTELGPGLNEYCYQEGLRLQFEEQGNPYQKELTFHPTYHGKEMDAVYRVDFLCKGDMRAQLYNYRRLLKRPCGTIVNFAGKKADVERYFYDDQRRNILTVDGRSVHKYRQ